MMPFVDLVTAALADPFRIALLVGLVLTQRRTAAATGVVAPLVLGVLFVALIIPMTMGFDQTVGLPVTVIAGLVANALWLVPILIAMRLWERRRG